MEWYDCAEQQLEEDLAEGVITQAEYNFEMRQLRQEYEEARSRAAQDAYDNY